MGSDEWTHGKLKVACTFWINGVRMYSVMDAERKVLWSGTGQSCLDYAGLLVDRAREKLPTWPKGKRMGEHIMKPLIMALLMIVLVLGTGQLRAQTGACGTHDLWADPSVPSYHLPAWQKALSWVQPAVWVYQATQYKTEAFAITSWTSSGNTITFTASATLDFAVGEMVTLRNFKVSTFFNGKTVAVVTVAGNQFTVTFSGATGTTDTGTVTHQVLAQEPDLSQPFVPSNTRAGDSIRYCQWVRVEGGTPPYHYSVQGAPPGLKVAQVGSDALYGGYASVPGKYTVTLCATDAAGTSVCMPPSEQLVCDGGKTACLP